MRMAGVDGLENFLTGSRPLIDDVSASAAYEFGRFPVISRIPVNIFPYAIIIFS